MLRYQVYLSRPSFRSGLKSKNGKSRVSHGQFFNQNLIQGDFHKLCSTKFSCIYENSLCLCIWGKSLLKLTWSAREKQKLGKLEWNWESLQQCFSIIVLFCRMSNLCHVTNRCINIANPWFHPSCQSSHSNSAIIFILVPWAKTKSLPSWMGGLSFTGQWLAVLFRHSWQSRHQYPLQF